MAKIPVGATIARAYSFAFRDFFKILGVIWLPMVIMSAPGFILMKPLMAISTTMASRDFSQVGHFFVLAIPIYLLMFFFMFMIIIGITQQALGMAMGSPFFYFSLGRPLWRLIGAFLLIILIIIASYLVMLLGGVILGILYVVFVKMIAPSKIVTGIAGLFAAAAFVAVFCAYIYALVRMTFLLVPVVVAEEKIGLKRSWALGRGNFWRMFAILLSIIIPLIVIELVFFFGFLSTGMPPMPSPLATPEQLATAQAAMASWNNAIVTKMLANWYITYPFWIVFSVLFYGVACGAQAFAYRAATQAPDGPWSSTSLP